MQVLIILNTFTKIIYPNDKYVRCTVVKVKKDRFAEIVPIIFC